ncbi:putative glycosyltransferase EpsF [mine drainage metagenome]|uniref:Putative glycosyltransferase EpsF n=1 Tax=mine drainage metagenome TaxID=410659 RepID=A0A1J5Q732_9ZZZZ
MKTSVIKKIKVLHVVPALEAGGIETLLSNILESFDRNKFEFSFITHKGTGLIFEKLISSTNIYVVCPKRVSFFEHVKGFLRVINRNKFDIIHIHQGNSSLVSLLLAWFSCIKIRIVHCHSCDAYNSFFNKIKFRINSNLINLLGTTFVACSNEAAVNQFGERLVIKNKVWIMKNAINLEQFHHDSKVAIKYRNELHIKEKYIIGMIARFSLEKNHDFSLSVFEEIARLSEDFHFVFIGDGVLLDSFKVRVSHSSISEKITFLGNRDDVAGLLSVFDAILIPSLSEGFGIVAVEAQACGIMCFVANNLSRDICLTDLVRYLSLDAGPEYWCNEILRSLPYKKYDRTDELKLAGFEIRDTANLLMKYYYKQILKYGK